MSKKINSRKPVFVALMAVLIVLGIAILASQLNQPKVVTADQGANSPVNESPPKSIAVVSDTDDEETYTGDEETIMVRSGLLRQMTLEDLMLESSLVVAGKIVGASEPFKIKPVFGDGDPVIHTDYYLVPSKILRGEAGNEQITVRVMAGDIEGEMKVIHENEPQFSLHKEYLLFLYQPGAGGGYNTKGDYYYVNGAIQGVFELEGAKMYRADSGISRTLSAFEQEIAAFNVKNPVDKDYAKNQIYGNNEANLKSGFISQEEYERYLEESREYAEIVQ